MPASIFWVVDSNVNSGLYWRKSGSVSRSVGLFWIHPYPAGLELVTFCSWAWYDWVSSLAINRGVR